MNRYLVRHNLVAYTPARWAGDYVRRFGARNEGFVVDAGSLAEATEIVRAEHRLNPSLVTFQLMGSGTT